MGERAVEEHPTRGRDRRDRRAGRSVRGGRRHRLLHQPAARACAAGRALHSRYVREGSRTRRHLRSGGQGGRHPAERPQLRQARRRDGHADQAGPGRRHPVAVQRALQSGRRRRGFLLRRRHRGDARRRSRRERTDPAEERRVPVGPLHRHAVPDPGLGRDPQTRPPRPLGGHPRRRHAAHAHRRGEGDAALGARRDDDLLARRRRPPGVHARGRGESLRHGEGGGRASGGSMARQDAGDRRPGAVPRAFLQPGSRTPAVVSQSRLGSAGHRRRRRPRKPDHGLGVDVLPALPLGPRYRAVHHRGGRAPDDQRLGPCARLRTTGARWRKA